MQQPKVWIEVAEITANVNAKRVCGASKSAGELHVGLNKIIMSLRWPETNVHLTFMLAKNQMHTCKHHQDLILLVLPHYPIPPLPPSLQ